MSGWESALRMGPECLQCSMLAALLNMHLGAGLQVCFRQQSGGRSEVGSPAVVGYRMRLWQCVCECITWVGVRHCCVRVRVRQGP